MKKINFVIIFYLLCFLHLSYAFSKYTEEAKPVIHKGIEYRAPHKNREYVEAWDVSNNKKIWDKRIYSTFMMPYIEQDCLWVDITDLKIENEQLIITNQLNRKYALDLNTIKVTLLISDELGNILPHFTIEDVIKKATDFLIKEGVSLESFERKEYFINSVNYDRKTKKWNIHIYDNLDEPDVYFSILIDDKTGEIDTYNIKRIVPGENQGNMDNNKKN